MAAKISLYRGVTYPTTYQHTDNDGNALPLTGCTVLFTVKLEKYDDASDDSSAVYRETITEHADPEGGITSWEITIPATSVQPGKYFFDIVVVKQDGEALPPVIMGECKIEGKVTNRYA